MNRQMDSYIDRRVEILKVGVGEYDVSTTSEPLKHQVDRQMNRWIDK